MSEENVEIARGTTSVPNRGKGSAAEVRAQTATVVTVEAGEVVRLRRSLSPRY
jgi:hypothetical protein